MFSGVKRVIFGSGEIRRVGDEAAALGSAALLVVGRHFMRESGRLAEIGDLLSDKGVRLTVFDAVPPEPTLADVEAGIRVLRSSECDLVIAIGGGSALDVGKAIAGLAQAPATVCEHFRGRPVEKKGLPFIAAPTTAGSGSEVTSNAVLIDPEDGIKTSIRSDYLYPDVAIVDPELTLTAPPSVTAQSGMDALCQALEALVSRSADPITDVLAKDASVRLLNHLPEAYAHGDDLDARTEVALGSLMGGIAFANARLGLAHGMAHPVGIATGLPHGLICGLLLPMVIRFNTRVAESKYAWVADNAGVSGGADGLVREIERLNSLMGLTERLPEMRIPEDRWPGVIAQSLVAGSTKSNPCEVRAEDIEKVLRSL